MATVSNTSPVLNLAIIGHQQLLQQQFGEILIPPAVLVELRTDTNFPGTAPIRAMLADGWLRVVELRDERLAQTLSLGLDQGEAAAIALALELDLKEILLDERDGRSVARNVGLEPVGVLGILLRGKLAGQIASVAAALTALREEAGFFVADELAAAVLAEASESS
jgi:predicted nucleic acid-binding protein